MASGPSSRRPTNRCTEISCPIRRIVIPRTASSRIRIAPAIARELLVAFGAAADQVTDAPRSLGGLRATPDGQQRAARLEQRAWSCAWPKVSSREVNRRSGLDEKPLGRSGGQLEHLYHRPMGATEGCRCQG